MFNTLQGTLLRYLLKTSGKVAGLRTWLPIAWLRSSGSFQLPALPHMTA
jgi:hypothetical protein